MPEAIQKLLDFARSLRESLREPHVIYMNFADRPRVVRCDELCKEIANALDESIQRAQAYQGEDEVLDNLLKQEDQMRQARRNFDVEALEKIRNSACGTRNACSACS